MFAGLQVVWGSTPAFWCPLVPVVFLAFFSLAVRGVHSAFCFSVFFVWCLLLAARAKVVVPRRLFICRSRYCCVASAGVKFFGAVAFLLSVFKGDSNCLLGFSLHATYCWCPSQFAAGFSRHAAPVWFSRGFGHAPVSKGFIRGLAILGCYFGLLLLLCVEPCFCSRLLLQLVLL
ncbi:hypothetical protein U1Q18_042610 [Sarracenia purpurea var. burkii]